MEQKNENFEPVEVKKEGGFWKSAKKVGIAVLKVAGIAGLGFAAGYVTRKYVDKEVYADAEAQRQWRERKQGGNN